MRDRTSAEPVRAQPSEQRPGRGLECGGRRAAAVTRRRGTWPPVTSSRVSLKLRLLKTPRTLVLVPSISGAGGCWWLLVAAGLQSGRGGLLSAGPGQRTADTAAALHRRSRHTPHPARVVTTARPGTRGTWPGYLDTWPHVSASHPGSAASLPLSGPGAAYGGWWPGWPVPHHHLPPPALQLSNDLFAIHNIHNS